MFGAHGTRRHITALAIAGLSTATLAGCGSTPDEVTQAPTPSYEEATDTPLMNSLTMSPAQANLTLDALPIQTSDDGDAQLPPLDDTATTWGWSTVGLDNPACTVTSAALARDADDIEIDNNCEISGGRWTDPLTNESVSLDDTEVTSFIPAQHIWDTGGSTWTTEQREVFTNSPFTLLTMAPDSLAERGDQSPATWRPEDPNLWCAYALRWIDVKNTFGLSLADTTERDALREMTATCPQQMDQAAA